MPRSRLQVFAHRSSQMPLVSQLILSSDPNANPTIRLQVRCWFRLVNDSSPTTQVKVITWHNTLISLFSLWICRQRPSNLRHKLSDFLIVTLSNDQAKTISNNSLHMRGVHGYDNSQEKVIVTCMAILQKMSMFSHQSIIGPLYPILISGQEIPLPLQELVFLLQLGVVPLMFAHVLKLEKFSFGTTWSDRNN